MENASKLPIGLRQHVLGFLSPSTSLPPDPKPNANQSVPSSAPSSAPSRQHPPKGSPTKLFAFEEAAVRSTSGFFVRDDLLGHESALTLAVKVRDACVTGEIQLHMAQMSHAAVARKDPLVRGDRTCWLTDQWKDPTSIFSELFTTIRSMLPVEDPQFGFIPERTSVQLAMYPGKGARYVEHRDTAVVSACDGVRGEPVRKYTLVYYLNPFWEEEHGGELRLEGNDLCPKLDRLVMFKSNMLHQVLPCFAPRWAVTVWLYGLPDVRVTPSPSPSRKRSIFVAIPSYRDPDCVNTIRDLFEKAARPDEITVGVYLQLNMAQDLPSCLCHELPREFANQTRFKLVSNDDAAGPGYARNQVHSLLCDETYILNIDAHTRFIKDWDAVLVDMLNALPSPEQSILTTYPQGFELHEGGDKTADGDLAAVLGPLVLKPWRFDDDGMLRLKSARQDNIAQAPLKVAFCAAGFNFCNSDVFRRVAYAPTEHLFFGEETVLSVRLWTHGYDFWAPHRDVVYHRWDRSYRNTFKADLKKRSKALKWVEDLLEGRVEDGFSLGKQRTVAEFEAMARLDFRGKRVLDS